MMRRSAPRIIAAPVGEVATPYCARPQGSALNTWRDGFRILGAGK